VQADVARTILRLSYKVHAHGAGHSSRHPLLDMHTSQPSLFRACTVWLSVARDVSAAAPHIMPGSSQLTDLTSCHLRKLCCQGRPAAAPACPPGTRPCPARMGTRRPAPPATA